MSKRPSASAAKKDPPPGRPRRRWPVLLAIGILTLVGFSGVGFVTVTALEDHDSFCIACHTVPETTYNNTAQAALDVPTNVSDLASRHYALYHDKHENFACIDCHRGDASLSNRVSAILVGARDTDIWVMGKADPSINKPSIRDGWLANAACISCHKATLLTVNGINTHFHNYLPAAGELIAQGNIYVGTDGAPLPQRRLGDGGVRSIHTSLTCTDCHRPHETIAKTATIPFLNDVELKTACSTCHRDAGAQ
ncbi:MAG TPA: hypothetical protein VMT34_01040 [Aggregatilineales bacterium]|nr:hypothetical protein [Aggregatilineales bacterium]